MLGISRNMSKEMPRMFSSLWLRLSFALLNRGRASVWRLGMRADNEKMTSMSPSTGPKANSAPRRRRR